MSRPRAGVHRVSHGLARGWVGVAAAVILLVGGIAARALLADPPDAIGSGDASMATLQSGPPMPPAPFFSGDRIIGLNGAQASKTEGYPQGGLTGWLTPTGVPSPDGKAIIYQSWQLKVPIDSEDSFSAQGIKTGDPMATPSVRLLDTSTGADTLLADGAYAVAWSQGGQLAYVKGTETDDRANLPYDGNVYVQNGPDAQAEAWTKEAAQYAPVAWAGDRLIVYLEGEGESTDVDVLDGPGSLRTLAPQAQLVALSPDGSEALLSEVGTAPRLALVDVASGKELSALDLSQVIDPATDHSLQYVGYAGDWRQDQVVASAGNSSLLILNVHEGQISVDRFITFPQDQGFVMSLDEPRFEGTDTSRVVAWVPKPDPEQDPQGEARIYSYVSCDVASGACDVGPTMHDRTVRAIENPSRPMPEAPR